jgi:hypothetical protein
MADATYQPKVYDKLGGAERVIADSGLITIESGGEVATESGGKISVESGGELEFDAGSFFTIKSTTVYGDEIGNMFLGKHTKTIHGYSDLTGATVITPAYGYHVYSAETSASLGSAVLPVASKGALLYLDGNYLVGDANISVYSAAGGGIANNRGSALSSLEIGASGYVELVCMADATWTIVAQNSITEHAS